MKISIKIILVFLTLVSCHKDEPVANIEDSLFFKASINGSSIDLKGATNSNGESLCDNVKAIAFKSFGPLYFNITPSYNQLRVLFGGSFLKNKFFGYQSNADYTIVSQPFKNADTFYSLFSSGQKKYLDHSTEYLSSSEYNGVYLTLLECESSKPCVTWYSYGSKGNNVDFKIDEIQILNSNTKSSFYANDLKTRRAVSIKGSFNCWLYSNNGLDSIKIENASFKSVILE